MTKMCLRVYIYYHSHVSDGPKNYDYRLSKDIMIDPLRPTFTYTQSCSIAIITNNDQKQNLSYFPHYQKYLSANIIWTH